MRIDRDRYRERVRAHLSSGAEVKQRVAETDVKEAR
jgi:hypothetical protein